MLELNKIYNGDCLEVLKTLPDNSVDCVVTSPPYWGLRDYGTATWEGGDVNCNHVRDNKITDNCNTGQINLKEIGCGDSIYKDICKKCGAKRIDKQLGLESTFTEYINKLCNIFDEIKKVLKPTGTCFVNLGDTYGGSGNGSWDAPIEIRGKQYRKTCNLDQEYLGPPRKTNDFSKSLLQIPSRFAIEMCNRGWILRNELIWHKPNCMPNSVKDRFTVDFEKMFFFVKNRKYYFEQQYEPFSESYLKEMRPMGVLRERMYENSKYKMDAAPSQFKKPANLERNETNLIGRNKRCVWKIKTKPFNEAHFAVYPEALCKTPIQAGCPLYVCSKCGKPREIIIERSSISEEYHKENEKQHYKLLSQINLSKTSALRISGNKYNDWKVANPDKFLGYTDCGCGAEFIPGIVLDPFFGSGTTGVTALKLNRNFVGIELNPEYIEIAQKRINQILEDKKLQLFAS